LHPDEGNILADMTVHCGRQLLHATPRRGSSPNESDGLIWEQQAVLHASNKVHKPNW
jgi:hypothetical protein